MIVPITLIMLIMLSVLIILVLLIILTLDKTLTAFHSLILFPV